MNDFDVLEELENMHAKGQESNVSRGYSVYGETTEKQLLEIHESHLEANAADASNVTAQTLITDCKFDEWPSGDKVIEMPKSPSRNTFAPSPTLKAIGPILEFAQPYTEYPNGVRLPAPVPVPPMVVEKHVLIEPPQDEELKQNPTELVTQKLLPVVPVSATIENIYVDKAVNNLMVQDMAEIVLSDFAARGDAVHFQKYIASGGSTELAEIPRDPWTGIQEGSVNAGDLWNSEIARPFVQKHLSDGTTIATDLSHFQGRDVRWPLLHLATLSNYGSVTPDNMIAMAWRICEDVQFDPNQYPESSTVNLPADSPVQRSALTDQNTIIDGIPFRGKGGQTRYCLQRLKIKTPVEESSTHVPVVPFAMTGCPFSRPTFCPPENAIFYRQDEIQADESGKVIFITPNLDWAFAEKVRSCHESIVTTAWRIEKCLAEGEGTEGVLPWYVFRGKEVHHLLTITKEGNARHDFDVALKVCRKIEKSGSGHAKIIVVKDGEVWKEVFDSDNFWKLREALELDDADLHDFVDLSAHAVAPGGPTGIHYIQKKNLILVLGEPKAGKTWFCLCAAWKLANLDKEAGLVAYLYAEGDPEVIAENIQIIDEAMRKEYPQAQGGLVVPVNVNDRDWGAEGFDAKRPECQKFLESVIEEQQAQYPQLSFAAVVLDNYATLLGKVQENGAAIPLLNLCKRIQDKGPVVLLACHTASDLRIAGSAHLARRANGVVRLSKRRSKWQTDIEERLAYAASRRRVKHKKDGDQDMCLDPLEMCLNAVKRDINADEEARQRPSLHVSFETFRGKLPEPEEIQIDLDKREIRELVITAQAQKVYARRYAEELLGEGEAYITGFDCAVAPSPFKSVDCATDIPAALPASSDHLPTFEQIKEMPLEEQKAALKEIVGSRHCRTRTNLANALGVNPNTMKCWMNGKIQNREIGLQEKAGRPKN